MGITTIWIPNTHEHVFFSWIKCVICSYTILELRRIRSGISYNTRYINTYPIWNLLFICASQLHDIHRSLHTFSNSSLPIFVLSAWNIDFLVFLEQVSLSLFAPTETLRCSPAEIGLSLPGYISPADHCFIERTRWCIVHTGSEHDLRQNLTPPSLWCQEIAQQWLVLVLFWISPCDLHRLPFVSDCNFIFLIIDITLYLFYKRSFFCRIYLIFV